MAIYLCIQHTYRGIDAALFNDSVLVQKVYEDKKSASKNIVIMIDSLLKNNGYSLDDLTFIAANQGPGPFTTLRVVISSVNGLAFATKKPLIGIDGLDAILEEYRDDSYPMTIALLDAFSQDVYFAFQHIDKPEREKGYKNILIFLEEIKNSFPKIKIQFIGNGSQKYRDEIYSILKEQAVFSDPVVQHCSIEQVGLIAFEMWQNCHNIKDQLLPTYLKDVVIKTSVPSSF